MKKVNIHFELFLVILLCIFMVSGCSKKATPVDNLQTSDDSQPEDDLPTFNYTSQDSAEAKTFALWLRGKITPPADAVKDILYNLALLREKYGKSYPVVNDRFFAPWIPSNLGIKFDSVTVKAIKEGTYREWEKLPVEYQPITPVDPDDLGLAFVRFAGFLHPKRLGELYKTLPGVISTTPNYYYFINESTFPMFPRKIQDGFSYVFTGGSNFAGYWYFKTINNQAYFIGYWDCRGTPPEWYSEAKLNIDNFYTWDGN